MESFTKAQWRKRDSQGASPTRVEIFIKLLRNGKNMGSKHEALLEVEWTVGSPAGAPTWKGPKQTHFIDSNCKILEKILKWEGKDSIEKPNFVSVGVRASKLIWVKSDKKGQGPLVWSLAGDPGSCSCMRVKWPEGGHKIFWVSSQSKEAHG